MASDIFIHDVYLHLTPGGVWFLVAIAFAVGGAFGSFFNVVAYRLPRGMSLNHPGSRCPACGHAIRWYDNVPIFGWLLLGGRCRDCRAAISRRYPLVELAVATATAICCYVAIHPTVDFETGTGVYALDAASLALHVLLVYTLVCAALLDFDRQPPPLRLLLAVLAIGIGVLLAAPDWHQLGRLAAVTLLFAALAWPMLLHTTDRRGLAAAAARILELAAVAAYLGLIPIAVVAPFAALCTLVPRFVWAGSLAIGTLIWLLAGDTITADWVPAAGDQQTLAFIAAGAIIAVVSIVARLLPRTRVDKTASRGHN